MHVVLIDYENVQPEGDWAVLAQSEYLVRIFVGSNQKKIPVAMSETLQPLGARCQYVRCLHSGSNALDFFLAFHLGKMVEAELGAEFTIISKDGDYDSLIKNLGHGGVKCRRVTSLAELVAHRSSPTAEALLEKVIGHLQKSKTARPRRGTTLRSTIKNITKASDQVVESLVVALIAREILVEAGGKVTYALT